MSRTVVMAVDGGNSKTDVALVSSDGAVLGFARGPLSSPHQLGLDGALTVLDRLYAEAAATAGLARGGGPAVAVAQLMIAGVDFPDEERALHDAAARRGWAREVRVANDCFAVLRSGTDRGWGIAVVCGAGINCVGIAPGRAAVRFPALGAITGDWGGGPDVGLAALGAAARGADGRGPRSSLEELVPRHFGHATPETLGIAIHRGAIAQARLGELAPLVFAEAERDGAAAAIVDRLADEVVALVRAALGRLEPLQRPFEIVLGGGLLRARDPRLERAVRDGIAALDGDAIVRVADAHPIVGAALVALDELGADRGAQERLRRELGAVAVGHGIEQAAAGGADG